MNEMSSSEKSDEIGKDWWFKKPKLRQLMRRLSMNEKLREYEIEAELSSHRKWVNST